MNDDRTTRGHDRDGTGPSGDGEAHLESPGVGVDSPEGRRDRQVSGAETGEDGGPAGDGRSEAPGGLRRRVPQVLALALVWVLLWATLTPATLVGGLLVGLLVTALFPLPLLPERLPLRPLKVLRLVGFLVTDLAVSGVRVSTVTLAHGPRARSGIVALPLCTGSDRTVTTLVAACALTPGSFTLQVDRGRRRWYVYALGLHRPGAVERVRRDMMTLQLRVIDAIGSEDDVRACRDALAAVAEGRYPAGGDGAADRRGTP